MKKITKNRVAVALISLIVLFLIYWGLAYKNVVPSIRIIGIDNRSYEFEIARVGVEYFPNNLPDHQDYDILPLPNIIWNTHIGDYEIEIYRQSAIAWPKTPEPGRDRTKLKIVRIDL